jgi:hypothetical protein
MMRARNNGDANIALSLPNKWRGEIRAVSSLLRSALIVRFLLHIASLLSLLTARTDNHSQLERRSVRNAGRLSLALLLGFVVGPLALAQDVNIQQATGGIAIGGTKNNRRSSFGTLNGLGIGTPVAGATVLSTTGGVLYTSPINLQINGAGGGNPAVVGVFVSSNFTHSSLLQAYSCIAGCTSAANYTAISLTSGLASDTPVIPSPGLITNQTITVFIGVFVSSQNGAAAVPSGTTDSVQITYQTFDGANGQLKNSDTLTLNNPNETLQTAVQLTLGTATGGLTISPATDYAANYGNVNGLGIGPGAGLTPVSVAGGAVYSTPYLIQPEFSDFGSTTATIKVTLTSNFAHPAILQLDDSGGSSGPFTQITTTPLTITSAATSFSSITRFLGLFVSNTNGPGAFTGSDTATLTFTLTVP